MLTRRAYYTVAAVALAAVAALVGVAIWLRTERALPPRPRHPYPWLQARLSSTLRFAQDDFGTDLVERNVELAINATLRSDVSVSTTTYLVGEDGRSCLILRIPGPVPYKEWQPIKAQLRVGAISPGRWRVLDIIELHYARGWRPKLLLRVSALTANILIKEEDGSARLEKAPEPQWISRYQTDRLTVMPVN
jgi:hypothetical protein